MNQTILNNTIIESVDDWHFVIADCSYYNPDLSLPSTYYDIFLPNYTTAKTVFYNPNELTVINTTQLGITTFTNWGTLVDGLWLIKQWYTFTPADPVCTEYITKNYFRIVNTKKTILEKIQLALDNCDCKEVDKWYSKLQDLELAKYMAENLCDVDRAIILYNGIKNQLQTCQTC